VTAPSAPADTCAAVVSAAKLMVEQTDEHAEALDDMTLDAVEALREALIAHEDRPDAAGGAGDELLLTQLRNQLADQAIEYIDAVDGSEECMGAYAEMVSTRLAIARLEDGRG
jgi:hypothetical protein